jgi:CRP-like cAMP-binding protein
MSDFSVPEILAPTRSGSNGGSSNIRNEILLTLPATEQKLILPKLENTSLKVGHILHEPGYTLKSAYFVNGGLVSLVSIFPDGKGVEVGLVGKEGFVGLPLVAGFHTANTRAIIQIEVSAFRIDAQALLEIIDESPTLARRLQQYAHFSLMEVTQLAACNRLHEVNERLARWLLTSADKVDSNLVPLTQESIALMLGTRRSSVTVAAGILESAGLISNARGRIQIIDRAKLEAASCGCYRITQALGAQWKEEARPKSSLGRSKP